MSLPKYDSSDKVSQKIFYSELKRQLDIINKIEDKKERSRKMAKLRLHVYIAITSEKKKEIIKKSFIRSFYDYIKQVIFNFINRIRRKN